MDATRMIQIAVAMADLMICQIRASPLWILTACLLIGGLSFGIIKTHRRK